MPIYRYEAIDRSGQLRRGAMDARDEAGVRARLQEMGFVPRAVASASSAASAPPQTQPQTAAGPSRGFATSSLPLKDQALFWRQLAEMARAGLSPFEMFRSIGVRTRNPRIRRAALDVANRTQAGSTVADALAANGDVFGTDFRMSVLAGEKGGFVHEVYDDFASSIEEEREHRLRWWWLRVYHDAMIVLGLIIVHGVGFVGRRISSSSILTDAVDAREWYAFLLDTVKDWVFVFGTRVIPLAVAVVLVWRFLRAFAEYGAARPLVDALSLVVPGYSGVARTRLIQRFYRMLRRLLSAGVPPLNAWDAAADATGHHSMSRKLYAGREALVRGEGFASALHHSGQFPYNDIQVMETADRTGRVPEMMVQLERDYAARAGMQSRVMKLLGAGVGMVLAAAIVIWAAYLVYSGYVNMYMKAADI